MLTRFHLYFPITFYLLALGNTCQNPWFFAKLNKRIGNCIVRPRFSVGPPDFSVCPPPQVAAARVKHQQVRWRRLRQRWPASAQTCQEETRPVSEFVHGMLCERLRTARRDAEFTWKSSDATGGAGAWAGGPGSDNGSATGGQIT